MGLRFSWPCYLGATPKRPKISTANSPCLTRIGLKAPRLKKWPGGYRWVRSQNVKPIEHYRRASIQATTTKRAG
jgi:hypothetical protein